MSEIGCLKSHVTILVIYVTAHRCAKKKEVRPTCTYP